MQGVPGSAAQETGTCLTVAVFRGQWDKAHSFWWQLGSLLFSEREKRTSRGLSQPPLSSVSLLPLQQPPNGNTLWKAAAAAHEYMDVQVDVGLVLKGLEMPLTKAKYFMGKRPCAVVSLECLSPGHCVHSFPHQHDSGLPEAHGFSQLFHSTMIPTGFGRLIQYPFEV